MKIYTRTGDKGTTGLADGARVSKSSLRIQAIGSLDEVNASLGFVLSGLSTRHETKVLLLEAQRQLFSCGAWLAMNGDVSSVQLPSLEVVKRYEGSMDLMSQKLVPLERFILPGGVELAARTHLARTQARSAERALVALKESGEQVDSLMLSFLNRLSDWLFVLSRLYNFETDVSEEVWES